MRVGRWRRVCLCVARRQAGLVLGLHDELLPELRSMAADQPLRERLQVQTMLALYRCGRQTDALELYSAARARLHDELGLEPGRELREVQRLILQQDPNLEVTRPEEPSATILAAACHLPSHSSLVARPPANRAT